jgi:integrase
VRWLRDGEEKRIAETINKNCAGQLPVFIIALHTCRRKSEQFSLEWKNVDLKRRKIFLGNAKNAKNKKDCYREIHMSDTCHRILEELFERRQKQKVPNKWVFQSTRYDQRLLAHGRSRMSDPVIVRARTKVQLIPDEELERLHPQPVAIVDIELKDRMRLRQRVDAVRNCG